MAFIAQALTALIGLVMNLAFYGRFSWAFTSPANHHLGAWVVLVPVVGGLIVGFMARWGSPAIRGHGIPEAMEQVLENESRIPPKMVWLKPVSSAIAIGTGGPFGAEGPIIATGGALGSLVGQGLHISAEERKTLLAAGAAAGMAAIFGSPVSAVLLAIELLLFEFRPRSLVPVTLASVAAAGVRYSLVGAKPVFAMTAIAQPSLSALAFYVGLGALLGLVAVGVTKLVYAVEDAFDHLPIHWMWWPAIGALAVGVVGYFAPLTLGVGYSNLEGIVQGEFALKTLLFLCVWKFVSWVIALGSGTSGGTLAPLMTVGGSLGAFLGGVCCSLFPRLGVDARVAGLVGMAAIFAGASRAVLASIVFAFETTQQSATILPLLGAGIAAYAVSLALMEGTIMTEKITRRGVRVPSQFAADFLERVSVRERMTTDLVTLRADQTLGEARAWLASGGDDTHFGAYPVVDENDQLVGLLHRRDALNLELDDATSLPQVSGRAPVAISESATLREAADSLVREEVGVLLVVSAKEQLVGLLTRGDVLSAHARRLEETHLRRRSLGRAN